MNVGHASDHVALNALVAADAFDLMLQGDELVALSFYREIVEILENAIETELVEALKDAGRRRDFPAFKAGEEPPRQFLRQFRQSPIPEFRNQDGFFTGSLGVAVWAITPFWTPRQLAQPGVPSLDLIRHREILMEIVEVGFDVEVPFTRAVINDQAS